MPPALDKAKLLGQAPKIDLTVVKAPDFLAWRKQYESFVRMSGLAGEGATDQDRVDFLHQCLSIESMSLVDNLGIPDADITNATSINDHMQAYVEGRVTATVERRLFRKRRQNAGEKVDDYLISLRELAKTCAFCNNACMESAIHDQFIEGLRDGEIVQELLKEENLTLTKAKNIA